MFCHSIRFLSSWSSAALPRKVILTSVPLIAALISQLQVMEDHGFKMYFVSYCWSQNSWAFFILQHCFRKSMSLFVKKKKKLLNSQHILLRYMSSQTSVTWKWDVLEVFQRRCAHFFLIHTMTEKSKCLRFFIVGLISSWVPEFFFEWSYVPLGSLNLNLFCDLSQLSDHLLRVRYRKLWDDLLKFQLFL